MNKPTPAARPGGEDVEKIIVNINEAPWSGKRAAPEEKQG